MAASGSFKTSGYEGWYLVFSWAESSQNIVANTTTISWKLTGVGGSGYYHCRNAKVTIDGETVYYQGKGTSDNYIKLYDGTVVASGTYTFTHDSRGEKTFTASAEAGIYVWAVNCTGSGAFTLDTIPQPSTVAVSQGTLGTEQTLAVTRHADSLTHTITYKCGSASGTVVDKSSSTSVKWTPPLDLAKQNTTGNSVSITLVITTYSGNTKIGSNSATFTATIPDLVKPTAKLTLSDPTGHKATYGGYVQGQSQLNAKLTGTGDQNSTIKSYQIKIGGAAYSVSDKTVELPYAESLEVIGTVTDSRTRTGSDSEIITVLTYTAPRISSLAVTRCDAGGTPQADGAYAKVTFAAKVTSLSNKNSAAYKIEYRKEGTSGWTPVDVDDAAGNYTPSGVSVIFPAAADSAFEVRAVATDDFGTVYSSLRTVPVAFALLQGDTTGTGLAVGQMATEPNVFAVGLPTKIKPGEVPYALDVSGDVRVRNVHGYVYGLGKAQSDIPAGADLNNYLDFGVYAIAGNDVAKTLANCPTQYAGTLVVSSGNGSGVNSGYYVYILQTYRTLDGVYEFTRGVYSDNTGEFKYQNWQCKSSPWWVSLGLSDKVKTAASSYGRAGDGCFYRVVNENHVHVAFNCALTYTGATIQINANAIPAKYRPARSVYSLCAAGGRTAARVCVSSSGNVYVEWVQDLTAAASTNSFELGWVDGYIDYWVV